MPPNQSPNPFARPSPWGNQPPTRISLAPRPAAGAPPEPRTYAAPAMVSGFSTPRPRLRPGAALTPAPVADPEAFAFDMSESVERLVLDAVAPMAMEPLLDVGRTPLRPARRRTRRDAPMAAYALGGLAAFAVVGLGVGAALLSHRPVETPSQAPPPALAPAVPASAAVAAAPALAPEPAAAPEPAVQASPALRPVMPRPKSRSAEAVAVRAKTPPAAAEPAESAPLLDLRPVQAAPVAPQPAPVLRPPADPEAPIPTRSRTPD